VQQPISCFPNVLWPKFPIYYTPTWTSFEQAWPVVPLFSFIYSTDICGGSATNSIENWVPFILNTKILEKIFVGILYDNEIIISHHCNSHCFDKFEKSFGLLLKRVLPPSNRLRCNGRGPT